MPRPPLPIGAWGRINRVQRAPKLWTAYARFRDHDGSTRQYERTGPTAQKAEDALKAFFVEHSVIPDAQIGRDTTLREVGEHWYRKQIQGRKAQNTQVRYRYILDAVVYPGLGGRRMRELSVATVDRFVTTVQEKRGDATARLCRTVLSGALGVATRLGALDQNPMRDVETIPTAASAPRPLTLDQVWDIRAKVYADKEAIAYDVVEPVDFMLGTGKRIGESLAARWFDLDIDGEIPRARIHATVVWVKGIGNIIQEHPKSDASDHWITLPDYLASMLRERREREAPNALELVFPGAQGGVRDLSGFRKHWRSIRARAGYDWVIPHTFRKTVATLIEDPELAKQQLGQSSVDITKRHYILQKTAEAPDLRDLLNPAFTQRKELAMPGVKGIDGERPIAESA